MTANNCGNPVTNAVVPAKFIQTAAQGLKISMRACPIRVWISALFPLILLSCSHAEKLDLGRLKLPPGFHIEVFANAPNARQMAFSPGGVLLVTDMSDGTVLALPDPKHTGQAQPSVPVLSGLNAPHGIAFHKGKL